MSRRGRNDAGQATVEFALALPVMLIMMLGLVQVGVAIRNELAVELAAREGARAAVVSSDPSSAANRAARRSVALPLDVSTQTTPDDVVVTVTYTDPTDVPIIGRFLGPSTHQATATMATEPD
ncbi:MAG: Flp pilus assembly protein TadG [Ilumatobacter sp.]|jgi:Flp pilus assembly protein TadG